MLVSKVEFYVAKKGFFWAMGIYAVLLAVIMLWVTTALEAATNAARGGSSRILTWLVLMLLTAFAGGILGGLIGSEL
jgi:hypothetical protein